MNTNLVVVRGFKEDRLFAMPMLHFEAHQLWGFGWVFLHLDRIVNVFGLDRFLLASLCSSNPVRTYFVYSYGAYTKLHIVVCCICRQQDGHVFCCMAASLCFRICKNVITDATVLVEGVFWPAPLNQPATNNQLQRLSCLQYVGWRIPFLLLLSCNMLYYF